MSYWLSSFVYRVDMAATTFVISGLGALVIALLIVGYQAIKTARGNPVEALQYE
jgi:putative ABC transport system permease protein